MPRTLSLSLLAVLFVASANSPFAPAQVSPEESLETLVAPEGMEVTLFASEPMITNPAAIDVDSAGRVWVAEIEFYRTRRGADKILVLEDTNGDGQADKSTVFADDVDQPMSLCVAGDKVYVLTSPDLWVYEDKDGDLVADGPPTKLLSGFHGDRSDHGAHGFILGPDHKWYLTQGDTGLSVTGTDGSEAAYLWGVMMRGEMDGSQLEIIAENFRNPYEIAVSSFGDAYTSDNDVDGNESVRICWILEGGNYGWFGGPPFGRQQLDRLVPPGVPHREHWHFRGYQPGFVPATIRTGFGAPCGMCFYEGDAFGERLENSPLHTDAGERVARAYPHENVGAGQVGESETILATTGDDFFRPDDICVAPDGSLFVSDWYDGKLGGHAFDNPDQGRIYRLVPTGDTLTEALPTAGPFETVAEAIEALGNPNLATQYLAREKLLSAGAASITPLCELLPSAAEIATVEDSQQRNLIARAMWVLDRIGGMGRRKVASYLAAEDDAFRALAVRILRRHGAECAKQLLPLAGDDSGEVRREVILLAGSLQGEAADAAVLQVALTYEGDDRFLLEAINIAAREPERRAWLYEQLAAEMTEEAMVARFPLMLLLNPPLATAWASEQLHAPSTDPAAARSLIQWLAISPEMVAGRAVAAVAFDSELPAERRQWALDRLSAQLHFEWRKLGEDTCTRDLVVAALTDSAVADVALALVAENRWDELTEAVTAVALDAAAPPELRQHAVTVAAGLRGENASDMLLALLASDDETMRTAAIEGLALLGDEPLLKNLLADEAYAAELRTAVAEELLESSSGAMVLVSLMNQDELPGELKELVLARATTHENAGVRGLLAAFLSEEQRAELLGEALAAEDILALSGDAANGREVFFHSAAQCASCHTVAGEGAMIGPELSMIGRKFDTQPLLETILDPSAAMAPEYVLHTVYTLGGKTLVGFVIEQNERQVTLRDTEGRLAVVQREDIEEIAPSDKSLMPDGVLQGVTAQQAADLLAFLGEQRDQTTPVESFYVLGPFRASPDAPEAVLPPEATLADPDLTATFETIDGREVGWERVSSDGLLGFAGIDTVALDRRRGFGSDMVAHYFLVYANSLTEQEVELLVGSDDSVRVWVNGEVVHTEMAYRAVVFGEDVIPVTLHAGRNVIVMKAINGNGPGGATMGIRSEQPVDLVSE